MQSIEQAHTKVLMSRIYLRGVDFMNLVERYLNSEFVNLNTPLKVNTRAVQHTQQDLVTVTHDTQHKPYMLDVGAGQSFICLGYKVYDNHGNYGQMDPEMIDEYNCMYCLMPFENLEDKSEVMGIPVKREVHIDSNGKKKHCYHMIDIFCCMRCMYREYKNRTNNKLYAQSECLISEIFTKFTGKDPSHLRAATDHRALEIFNGLMSWEEYHADTTIYERPGNVYFVPVIEYLGSMS